MDILETKYFDAMGNKQSEFSEKTAWVEEKIQMSIAEFKLKYPFTPLGEIIKG